MIAVQFLFCYAFAYMDHDERNPHFDAALRPSNLHDFVGHPSLRKRLSVSIMAAKERGDPLGHLLFYGPPGLGKTTLAHILAKEMGKRLVVTSGPVIEKAGDLAGLLTSLDEGDLLFIDEIHRLSRQIEEYLYPALEDFCLDLVVDSGANARSIQMKLNRFTLLGATTRVGAITAPLRSRFHLTCKLDYYPDEELAKIVVRSSALLDTSIDPKAAFEVAKRSRGTPRIANNLIRWVRDVAQTSQKQSIDSAIVHEALAMLSIDERGLDEIDKRILQVIAHQHKGGPVGVGAIAASLGEEAITIEEVYEPFLIMKGLLRRTPRGRELTPCGYEHLEGTAL